MINQVSSGEENELYSNLNELSQLDEYSYLSLTH